MPELPEVETTRLGIKDCLENQVLAKMIVRQPKLRWPINVADSSHVEGLQLKAVKRRGKYIDLDFGVWHIYIHLGMSGCLTLLEDFHLNQPAPSKHCHVDWVFNNNFALRLNDPRRFGAVFITKDGERHVRLKDLGPEPFSDNFNADYFHSYCEGRKRNIKNVLMDSKVVVGVGNIYANEVLFNSGILPSRLAGSISLSEAQNIVDEVRKVLKNAIAQGGTTLKDFHGADGKPGYFSQKLNVYGREGKPCVQCQQPLQGVKISGRQTVFCNFCQH